MSHEAQNLSTSVWPRTICEYIWILSSEPIWVLSPCQFWVHVNPESICVLSANEFWAWVYSESEWVGVHLRFEFVWTSQYWVHMSCEWQLTQSPNEFVSCEPITTFVSLLIFDWALLRSLWAPVWASRNELGGGEAEFKWASMRCSAMTLSLGERWFENNLWVSLSERQ